MVIGAPSSASVKCPQAALADRVAALKRASGAGRGGARGVARAAEEGGR